MLTDYPHFQEEAGLPEKAELFLTGRIGWPQGHYLSAMAMNYTAVKNEECRKRMEYIISELRECQEAMGKYLTVEKDMSVEF